MGMHELARLRKIALALPEVNERLSHGAACFFIRDKRPLCRYHDHHRGDDRISLWCPVPDCMQEALVDAEPKRFFKPQPSASGTFSGWLGVFLDVPNKGKSDWDEIAAILEEAFRKVAPRDLIAELDNT